MGQILGAPACGRSVLVNRAAEFRRVRVTPTLALSGVSAIRLRPVARKRILLVHIAEMGAIDAPDSYRIDVVVGPSCTYCSRR